MTAASQGTGIFDDVAAEEERLEAVLAGLSPGDWALPSAAPGWTVADVVLHLAQTEELTASSAAGQPLGLTPPGEEVRPGGAGVDGWADGLVAAQRGQPASEVFERWRTARRAALTALQRCEPGKRLPWVAGSLSPRTLATTRLAEHWAHALDITAPLGIPYPDTSRLRHIAWLATRTLPYAFAVAGQPGGPVRSELTGPGGERWEFGPEDAPSVIAGTAAAFCRVAAQRLAPEGSGLTATGPDAPAALRVLRTYAA
jgi:uncharacterized protein (TIGR03084 family)